jgi:hypothetical protein
MSKIEFFHYLATKFNQKSKSELQRVLLIFSWQSLLTARIIFTSHHLEVIIIAYLLRVGVGGI